MPTIRDSTDQFDIYLTEVDHVSDAESAAQWLFRSAYDAANAHGGSVHLLEPSASTGLVGWGVTWKMGPPQWADAYVTSEGADAIGFVAEAVNGDTVVFSETD